MNTKKLLCLRGVLATLLFGIAVTALAQINKKQMMDSIPQEMLLYHQTLVNNQILMNSQTLSNNGRNATGTGSDKAYYNILMAGPFVSAPQYFYINTKIPFVPEVAPQIHITGYNYSHPNTYNRAVKLTLGWYVWEGNFHWSQYRCDLGYYNPSRIRLGTYNDAGIIRVRIEIANDGTYWSSYSFSAQDHHGDIAHYENWAYYEGSMPVGTSNITTVQEYNHINIGKPEAPATLTVAGDIRAREVRVDINAGADFVFESDYSLLSLEELEQFITTNKHLPDIAPANEMEQNGIDMGEMQIKLLQKIEELTLYIIEQNKRMQEQDKKMQKLETEIEAIKNK
jgi:hypothetical protein